MSAYSGRRSLAALSAELVPCGRGTDAAVRGILAAVAAVTAMATAPGTAARQQFNQAVTIARSHADDAYSRAFMDTAWLAIDELRDATEGTY
jgi:hypothetical protein